MQEKGQGRVPDPWAWVSGSWAFSLSTEFEALCWGVPHLLVLLLGLVESRTNKTVLDLSRQDKNL